MRRILPFLAALAILGSVWPSAAAAGGYDSIEPGAIFRSVHTGEDGETIVAFHQRPVSYVDSEGELRPIDVTLRATEWGYENRTNTLGVSFPERLANGWQVELRGGGVHFQPLGVGLAMEGDFAEWAMPGDAVAVPGEEPGTLLYEESFPGMSDLFEVRRGQVEHIVRIGSLEDLPAGEGDLVLRYHVTVNGGLEARYHPLTIAETDEGNVISLPFVSLESPEGEVRGVIPTPSFWDSGDPMTLAGGNLIWEEEGAEHGLLTLRFSRAILERMTFPVDLDPQVWQAYSPLNVATGAAWGHIFDSATGTTYNVRFNGYQFQVGAYEYDFGPPLGVQFIEDSVATPVWDLSYLPGHITDAWVTYAALIDSYDGKEKVVINDHKTDVLNDALDAWLFINNIADGRNAEDYRGSPDFSKDKRYLHAFHGPQEFDVFSDSNIVKLTGRALHDIHKSVRGQIETPSAFPLKPGYFAVAIRDTSEYRGVLGMWLFNVELRVRTN